MKTIHILLLILLAAARPALAQGLPLTVTASSTKTTTVNFVPGFTTLQGIATVP